MEGMGELMEEVGKEEEKDGAEAEGSGDGGLDIDGGCLKK